MEFAVDSFSVVVDQLEGVWPIAIHVTVAIWDTTVTEQEGCPCGVQGRRNTWVWFITIIRIKKLIPSLCKSGNETIFYGITNSCNLKLITSWLPIDRMKWKLNCYSNVDVNKVERKPSSCGTWTCTSGGLGRHCSTIWAKELAWWDWGARIPMSWSSLQGKQWEAYNPTASPFSLGISPTINLGLLPAGIVHEVNQAVHTQWDENEEKEVHYIAIVLLMYVL